MDDFESLSETSLPKKEAFYSSLNDEDIIDEQYQHAQDVYKKFVCKNLGELYHDLYVRTDVRLLADVFEDFRATCLNQYGLDTAHYYTSPGLSWDALLKHSNIRLELTDYDIHLFIEKGLRGGMAMVSQIYSKANNPYLKDYDQSKPTSYIQYLDANNRYGWVMNQPLPIGKFKWLINDEIDSFDIESIGVDSKKVYI